MSNGERRYKRKIIQLMQSEASWLQRALFALQKAEGAREKLADTQDRDLKPYVLKVTDGTVSVEDVEDALEDRVQALLGEVRERRKVLR